MGNTTAGAKPRTPRRDFEAVLEGNVMSSDETWGAVASHLSMWRTKLHGAMSLSIVSFRNPFSIFGNPQTFLTSTLLRTNISPPKAFLNIIFFKPSGGIWIRSLEGKQAKQQKTNHHHPLAKL